MKDKEVEWMNEKYFNMLTLDVVSFFGDKYSFQHFVLI